MSSDFEALNMQLTETETTVSVRSLSKKFRLFKCSRDRLKQHLFPWRKYYDEFWALQDVGFDIKKGESVAILGHNGAGKSTLLQILAGTVRPTSGYAMTTGRIGTLMSISSGYRMDFTGRENIFVLAAVLGLSRSEIRGYVPAIEDFADLGSFIDQPVRTYSTGMLTRLAFGIYTCLSPDLLIVDEVLHVGDAAFKNKCLRHIERLIQTGTSMLLVSHNPPVVEQFCQRAIVMEKGKIVYSGDVQSSVRESNKRMALLQGNRRRVIDGKVKDEEIDIPSTAPNETVLVDSTPKAVIRFKKLNVPVFVDSIPKAGTHLLSKALNRLPGIVNCGMHLERKTIARFVDAGVSFPVEGREDIDADRDLKWIERFLNTISPGTYLTTHFAYHKKIHEILNRLDFKIIVLMRDPRDIVLSWSDYMATAKHHLLYQYFSNKEPAYRIMCGIVGESKDRTGTRRQPSISELIHWHFEWIKSAGAHMVRFEDLVGEQGGGARERQYEALTSISKILGMDHPPETITTVANSLFGDSATFNIGTVGRWQKEFSGEHKASFKKVAGKELIELGYEQDFDW